MVPIVIDGSINIQKKGSRLIRPGKVRVKILHPVSFNKLYSLDNKEFSSTAANRVREALLLALENIDQPKKKGYKK